MKRAMRAAVALLAVLMALPGALAEYAAKVTASGMPVYADEALSWELGTLKKDAVVTVESRSGEVARVAYQGKFGYARVSDMEALSGEATEATLRTGSTVYQKANGGGRSVRLKKSAKVKLLATSGSYAMIARNGYIGYTALKNLTTGEKEKEPEKSNNSSVTVETYQATVIQDDTAVYASASSAARLLGTLKKGVSVTVVARNDTWACLKKNDAYGFCLLTALQRGTGVQQPEATPAPTTSPETTPQPSGGYDKAVQTGKYSNEELIYIFLTKDMGLNCAAACGILSNIKSESSFNPNDYYGGSYGICQWLGSRLTNLKNYCAKNGYDYTTLTGQLHFLAYELETGYPKIYTYMKNVENTASGAYDAGYYWCYNYERPANKGSRSVTRGNAARDTYWPKYSK